MESFSDIIGQLRPDCQACSLPFQDAVLRTEQDIEDLNSMGQWPASLAADEERIRQKLESRHRWAILNVRCFVNLAQECAGTSSSGECQRVAQ